MKTMIDDSIFQPGIIGDSSKAMFLHDAVKRYVKPLFPHWVR